MLHFMSWFHVILTARTTDERCWQLIKSIDYNVCHCAGCSASLCTLLLVWWNDVWWAWLPGCLLDLPQGYHVAVVHYVASIVVWFKNWRRSGILIIAMYFGFNERDCTWHEFLGNDNHTSDTANQRCGWFSAPNFKMVLPLGGAIRIVNQCHTRPFHAGHHWLIFSRVAAAKELRPTTIDTKKKHKQKNNVDT